MNNLMTTTEVAAYLKVSTTQVRRLCMSKKLKARKLGKEWLIQRSELCRIKYGKSGRPRTGNYRKGV